MILAGVVAGEVTHGGGGGTPVLVAHVAVQQGSSFTQPGPSSAIDTTGANFIAMAVNAYDNQASTGDTTTLVADNFGSAPVVFAITGASYSGSTLTLTGTFTGGGSNAFASKQFVVAGFQSQPSNNGYWNCTASSTTSIDLTVPGGASGSSAGAYCAVSVNAWKQIPQTDRVFDFGGGNIWYCTNPTVGANHYFLEDDRPISGAGDGSSFAVAAFSGVKTTSPYVQNVYGAQIGSGSTVAGGAITPTTGNLLLCYVTGLTLTGTFTVDSGFTITDAYAGGSIESPIGLAYLVPGSASPVTPTWTLGAAIGNRGRCQTTEFKHS